MPIRSLARKFWRKLTPNRPRKTPFQRQIDHLRGLIAYEPSVTAAPVREVNLTKLRITWVIPDFIPGAGGHMTIFRIASYLERFGHEVQFLVQNPSVHKTAADVLTSINTHFQPFHGPVHLFNKALPEVHGDAVIATDRFTCYPVRSMNGFSKKFYFVQDFEANFYPSGTEALLTEATYHFDFDCLCAGEWLHKKMERDYGRWSMSWPLAYDRAIYNINLSNVTRHPSRIAVYARYVTPRRAVELAFLALEILHRRGVSFEVDFFGWQLGKMDVPFPYRDHGILNGSELSQLYQASTVGVVFSATNHSLVNKEMMACGLPVVDLDLETVRSIFPQDVMAFAKPTPEGIADELERILSEPEEQQRLRERGLSFVNQLSWERSARLVEEAIKARVHGAAGQVSSND